MTLRKGTTLREVLAILVAVGILSTVTAAGLRGIREMSKREECASNLRRVGLSCKIYANADQEKWPIPAFKQSLVDHGGIDYLNHRGGTYGDPIDPGEVGFDRLNETTNETSLDPSGGSTAVSTTRSLWLLVRSGDLRTEDFICPSSRDEIAPDDFLFDYDYFDFPSYHNVSYGYQVPFGPRDTQPREGIDYRQVLIADKGPYYLDDFDPSFETRRGKPLYYDDSPIRWRRYNSPNHGREGQNVVRADGSSFFSETPLAGVNGDNIYTLMVDGWDENGFNRIHGEAPHFASVPNPYPGQNALDPDAGRYASTDSLIYP